MPKTRPILDINFRKVVELLLPGVYRKPIFVNWLNALVFPLEYIYRVWRFDYLEGAVYNQWDNVTAYNKGDRVIYKTSTYEALADNTNVIPELNRTQWLPLNDTFIGVYDRVRYTGQKISLEGFLNAWYQNQGNPSQIYIENNALKVQSTYFFNEIEGQSTYIANQSEIVAFSLGTPYLKGDFVQDGNDIFMALDDNTNEPTTNETFWRIYPYIVNESEFFGGLDFTVFVPIALYNTLGDNTIQRDGNVQSQVDKYKPFGTNNDIQTY